MNIKPTITTRFIKSGADFKTDFESAKKIRYEVFVVEQKVPLEEEFDAYETESRHILAFENQIPVGTARWRKTDKGIKLERFAVMNTARGKGVGSILVKHILEDIQQQYPDNEIYMYLHTQVSAVNLYARFGFKQVGEMFEECNIQHYYMERMMSMD